MFSRPALLDLINRTRDDLLTRLTDGDPLRRSDATVYARVLAGGANEMYGYLDWLARNIIYDTAESEMLDRWASIWSITRLPSVEATGAATFTGNIGAIVPAGSILQGYDGAQYATVADITLSGGAATVNITASTGGVAGNRTSGQTLTLTSPLAGVNSSATASAITGGGDIEGDDSLRARFLGRIRQPPHGGALFDYVGWGLQVPGFTRIWAYGNELGAGTVTVRGMCDNSYLNGIPLSGDISALQAYLNSVRPVTAAVTAVAPIANLLNFTITGSAPGTTTVHAAVQTSLQELILAEASPGGTLLYSHITAAISNAAGEYDYTLTSPTGNVTNSTGYITTLGTITWA